MRESPRTTSLLPCIILPTLFALVAVAGEPVQWDVASGGNGHWYRAILIPEGITWTAAQNAAEEAGGYLATSTSDAENTFIYSLVSDDDRFWFIDAAANGIGPWLGGFQPEGSVEPGGGWTWVTGEPFSFTKWATPEPNNSAVNENRISLHGYRTLKAQTWNDYPDIPTPTKPSPLGYIEEFDVPPPPIIEARVSQIEICWESFPNASYRVEYRSTLTTNEWTTLFECVRSTNAVTCVYDNVPAGEPKRFYQVVVADCDPGS